MDCEIKNSQECYNFPLLREFLRKYKTHSAKRQHPPHHHHHRHRNVSSNHKIKPGDDCKSNHHAFEEDIFKATYYDKKQDGKHIMKKGSQNENYGVKVQLNQMSHKHNSHHHKTYDHDDNDHSCFKAFMSLSAPSKKKKVPSRISSFEPSTTHHSMKPVEFGRNLSRARSLETAPSLGRTRSISNSRNERGMKSPSISRAPSMINRTTSTGSRATSFNGRNDSFSRTSSIGRSKSDAAAKARNKNLSKSGPIMFSNSSGMMKPPATEQQLECTLEELYHGCVKHIKVSRDVYTFAGQRIQEEEVLTVNIKPGWKTGTKITFKGTTTDERPGEYRGDIVFVITEKGHPLFRRIDDDLELEIEIPLVDALTGCSLYIPLLGREKMFVTIDDIVYPGYQKTFVGQGMPNQKNPHHKGDLTVKFLVDFPSNLTDEQRSEICNLLGQ